jgi:uncharacterized protein (DUF362 family)/Pyruvate/2-oxoacid:ferredoxin oxidoreductase delta subunit
MGKTKVAVMQCGSYDTDEVIKKINEGVKLLGGWERMLKPGMNVLLKINLISPVPSETAAVTHCGFVRAVARIIKQHGCNVWIGDSAGGAITGKAQTTKALSVSGMAKVAEEEGAVIKNFDTEGVVETEASGVKLYLAKPLFDADLVINMPKLKTHMLAAYTGAVKNMFGCVPGQKKAEYHRAAPSTESLGRTICDINKSVKVGLNIMDGILAMDGQGPVAGHIYEANKILISEDRLALDAVAVGMIGRRIEDLPMFKAPIEHRIGEWKIHNIEVCGDYDAPPRLAGFKVPKAMHFKRGGGVFKIMLDLMKTRPQMDLSKCVKCNVCVDSCPVGAIDRETKRIDYDKCIGCMCCHELCIYKAVKLVRANRVMRLFSR